VQGASFKICASSETYSHRKQKFFRHVLV
jgi:hypothetical protein